MAVQPEQISTLPKFKVRKLTTQDIEAIASFVCKEKLTEAEACHQLDINPMQWYKWKSRVKRTVKFENICTRIKGATISHAMKRIENAGIRDWRADHARLALIDPKRFGQRTEQAENDKPNLLTDDVIEKVMAMYRKSKESVIDVESSPVKQIE